MLKLKEKEAEEDKSVEGKWEEGRRGEVCRGKDEEEGKGQAHKESYNN